MAAAVSLVDEMSPSSDEAPSQVRIKAAPDRKKGHAGRLVRAEEDLEWRFRVCDHAIQFGAQKYDSATFGAVFDDLASWTLHGRLHEWHRRQTVVRMRTVDVVLGGMDTDDRQDARAIYSLNNRWRDILGVALMVAESAQRPSGVITLTGVLPRTEEAQDAFVRAHGGNNPRSDVDLLDWAEEAIRPPKKLVRGMAVTHRIPSWFKDAREACEAIRMRVLTSYSELLGKASKALAEERKREVEEFAKALG